jgi:hypothetical protein
MANMIDEISAARDQLGMLIEQMTKVGAAPVVGML